MAKTTERGMVELGVNLDMASPPAAFSFGRVGAKINPKRDFSADFSNYRRLLFLYRVGIIIEFLPPLLELLLPPVTIS